VDGKASLKGAWLSHVNHLYFGGHNHIPGTADHLRCCQLSFPVSVKNVEICIQQLGRVDEMVFTARRSYASAVFGRRNSVCLSVHPSVTCVLCG